MMSNWRWHVGITLALLTASGFRMAVLADEPKAGLAVGELVPIASMRCVVGIPTDRNTCLAGKYQKVRAFSIYVRSPDEQHLNDLLKQINALLAEKTELRGYVLLVEGKQFDETLKGKLRDWFEQQKITKLDVAIANTDPLKTYGLAPETRVAVVYSESRLVKYRRDFAAGTLDAAALKELAATLAELSR